MEINETQILQRSSGYVVSKQIDTQFNVWVLSSSRDEHTVQLPEIGGDDPSLSPSTLCISCSLALFLSLIPP